MRQKDNVDTARVDAELFQSDRHAAAGIEEQFASTCFDQCRRAEAVDQRDWRTRTEQSHRHAFGRTRRSLREAVLPDAETVTPIASAAIQ
jgi:hypothetical protein